MTRTLCVVPARMASSRFPGKPLKPLLGLPLVLHVYERCRLCSAIDRIVVATCDDEIRVASEAHGAEVVMTADTHPGCVDRTEEAVANLDMGLADDDLVLMVQGDDALVGPDMLMQVIDAYRKSKAPVVNLASPILRTEDHDDPNCVKVAAAHDGHALYFSRAPIPSRAGNGPAAMLQQTGVIGFSKAFLETFGRLPQTPLEKAERIDMLRTLEHGYPIRIVATGRETVGVDTPADLARAETMLRTDPWTREYIEIPD